jgi:hypothetical protein
MFEAVVVIVVAVTVLALWAVFQTKPKDQGAERGDPWAGAKGVTPKMTTTPRGFTRLDMGPVRLAAAGHQLSAAGDDFHDAPKQIENLNMELRIAYRNAAGEDSVRAVIVERAYGDLPTRLTHVRGMDTQSDERRTFRLNRVVALQDPVSGELLDEDIGTLIWREAVAVSGLSPLDLDAYFGEMPISGRGRIAFRGNDDEVQVYEVELRNVYRSGYNGVTLRGDARRRPEDNPGRRGWGGSKAFPLKAIEGFHDLDAGTDIDDVLAWVKAKTVGVEPVDDRPPPERTPDRVAPAPKEVEIPHLGVTVKASRPVFADSADLAFGLIYRKRNGRATVDARYLVYPVEVGFDEDGRLDYLGGASRVWDGEYRGPLDRERKFDDPAKFVMAFDLETGAEFGPGELKAWLAARAERDGVSIYGINT